ncbi:hypothetical protein Purlil1_8259 [Purpureocillium lilacinum]|uniref:Uncharacterized protein n=1 Tax=Purpureocillium lilacinum TaxID=33203 RepID=A0ABR0BU55_PURLI|nr:hypothetical protein Purlil1_8259 [Purpureocillium lilacinum]
MRMRLFSGFVVQQQITQAPSDGCTAQTGGGDGTTGAWIVSSAQRARAMQRLRDGPGEGFKIVPRASNVLVLCSKTTRTALERALSWHKTGVQTSDGRWLGWPPGGALQARGRLESKPGFARQGSDAVWRLELAVEARPCPATRRAQTRPLPLTLIPISPWRRPMPRLAWGLSLDAGCSMALASLHRLASHCIASSAPSALARLAKPPPPPHPPSPCLAPGQACSPGRHRALLFPTRQKVGTRLEAPPSSHAATLAAVLSAQPEQSAPTTDRRGGGPDDSVPRRAGMALVERDIVAVRCLLHMGQAEASRDELQKGGARDGCPSLSRFDSPPRPGVSNPTVLRSA